jgi:hypothetical protein
VDSSITTSWSSVGEATMARGTAASSMVPADDASIGGHSGRFSIVQTSLTGA